jgi:hypothetical protein
LRCPSVINVEGLRSYKAIAFIASKSNPRNTCLEAKTYCILCVFLQKITLFSKNFKVSFRNTTRCSFNEKIGDEEWKR